MELEGVSFEGRWNINVFMYQDGYRVVDIIDSIWKHSEYEIIITSWLALPYYIYNRIQLYVNVVRNQGSSLPYCCSLNQIFAYYLECL